MKISKIFIVVATVLAFTACSNKTEWDIPEDWNTSEGVTVAMGKATYNVSEAKGLINIPITVTGERNANVKVTVEVSTGDEENPAMEDKNYLITSKSVIISPDQNEANIEIITVDDDEINEKRVFNITLVGVQGATIDETNKVTVVTLKDNDALFYEKFAGKWKMTFQSAYEEEPVEWDCVITVADEDEPDYEKYMYVSGMMGYSWTQAVLEYNYDKETKQGSLSFVPGATFAEEVNFGLGGYNNVFLYGMSAEGKPVDEALVGTWSEDFKTITFQQDPEKAIGIYFYIDGGYTWDKGTIESMTKSL
jgi:hypothetical protein